MLFGRSNQQQAQGANGAAENMQPAGTGYGAQPQASPWQTAGGTPLAGGYPSQPAGNGYAGYTPGQDAGQAGGWAQGASAQGMNPYAQGGIRQPSGYPQAGAGYSTYPQAGQPYGGQAGQGYGGQAQPYGGQTPRYSAPAPSAPQYTRPEASELPPVSDFTEIDDDDVPF